MVTKHPERVVGVSPLPSPEPAPPEEEPTLDLTLPPPGGITWKTARNWALAGAAAVAVGLVLAGLVLAPGQDGDAGGTVVAPLDGRAESELHLVSGTGTVTVRGADLDGDLYRISTPPDGDAVPRVVDRDGRVELHLVPSGRDGPAAVEVALSTDVRWQIRLSGGAVEQVVDMTAGGLAGVDFVAGATRIELSLPRPEGTVTVRVGAGASELTVTAPDGVPLQARLNNGAGQAIIDGARHNGIAPGSVLTSVGWEAARDRYELDSGGLGTLIVDHR